MLNLVKSRWFSVQVVLGASAAAACWAQGVPVSTGSVQGSVVADSGVVMPNATVSLYPMGASSRFTAKVVTSASGAFTLSAVPAGRYIICARPATTAFVDSCTWGVTRLMLDVAPPARTPPIAIHLKPASVVKVRINDSGGYLQRRSTDKTGPHVLVGVWSLGRLVPADISGQDKTGIDYSLRVPLGIPLPLRVYSSNVKLEDPANAPVGTQGYSSVVLSSANLPSTTLVFTAVGRLP